MWWLAATGIVGVMAQLVAYSLAERAGWIRKGGYPGTMGTAWFFFCLVLIFASSST